MNVLVTGGGGFLGTRIVQMLLGRGEMVRVLGRNEYRHLLSLGAECIKGDIRNFSDVSNACLGMDAVIHVAAKAGVWGNRKDYFEINIKGTANVIQACLEHKIRALVYTSSPSVVIAEEDIVNGDESLPYARRFLAFYPASKAEAEEMVLKADGWEMVKETPAIDGGDIPDSTIINLRTCAIRPHLIWGPGDANLIPRIVAAAKDGKLRKIGNGKNVVDITYVDNAAIAHLLALDELLGNACNGGKAYFVGDEKPVVLWDWINQLLARLNVASVKKGISYFWGRKLGVMMELLYYLLPLKGEPPLTRFVACQFAHSHSFSHKNALRDFGYKPIVDNEEGMRLLLQSLQER